MTDLPNDTKTLKENIEQLLEENTQLKTENAQLKAENAELRHLKRQLSNVFWQQKTLILMKLAFALPVNCTGCTPRQRLIALTYLFTKNADLRCAPVAGIEWIEGKRKFVGNGDARISVEFVQDAALAFAFEEDVPFTNNQAERDLRAAKVKQKIIGCFRTVEGAKVYARLQSAVLTVRKRGESVFNWLLELFLPPKSYVIG